MILRTKTFLWLKDVKRYLEGLHKNGEFPCVYPFEATTTQPSRNRNAKPPLDAKEACRAGE